MTLEKMEKLLKLMNSDNFAHHCGMEVLEASEGYSKAKMTIGKEHLNFFGTVHGGAIFSLADMAFGAAANSHGKLSMAISCSIHYVKAARKGSLTAIAREVSINPRIASYSVNIYDDEEEVVAIFQGMVYRKDHDIL